MGSSISIDLAAAMLRACRYNDSTKLCQYDNQNPTDDKKNMIEKKKQNQQLSYHTLSSHIFPGSNQRGSNPHKN